MRNLPEHKIKELFEPEIIKISNKYKITRQEVIQLLADKLEKSERLTELLISEANYAKNSEYKDFVKKFRKEIYYKLRKYQINESLENDILQKLELATNNTQIKELLTTAVQAHVSTKERLPYIQDFSRILSDFSENTKSILDVGGGLYPLIFPFDDFPNLKKYCWVDKDKSSYSIIKHLSKLHPQISFEFYQDKIGSQSWQQLMEQTFDLVLMFKLVPIVWRQDREILHELAKVKSHRILLTGNVQSMTKHKSIKTRELHVIKSFITMSGREIEKYFEIPTEFGYILK